MLSYRLREAMELRGLTQDELAERSGVSQPHISRILRGEREPTVDRAVRIAYALGVSLDWLCGLSQADSEALSPDEDELLAAYRAIEGGANKAVALRLVKELSALE